MNYIFTGSNGLQVEEILINRDIPIMIITTLACMPIFWSNGRISRQEGGILIALYFLYLIDQVLPISLPSLHDGYRLMILCTVLPLIIIFISYQTIHYWMKLKKKDLISS